MKRSSLIIFCIIVFLSHSIDLKGQELTAQSTISVLTCGPGEDIYTLFGHTAIRVQDYAQGIDFVYNYGTFDFEAPNFYPKFLRGQLPYSLQRTSTERFLTEYNYYQRFVKEQVFELSLEERNLVFQFLEENNLPQNREYFYDFYFDNCTTRIRELLRSLFYIEYPILAAEPKTYRDLLHEYNFTKPWVSFGMDIILGTINDRPSTDYTRMFLPEYFYTYLNKATLPNGAPLVRSDTFVLAFPSIESTNLLLTPWVIFGILLLVEVFMSILLINYPNKRVQFIWDGIWFFSLFVAFVILVFMWFFTNHYVCSYNFNLLWTIPWLSVFFLKNRHFARQGLRTVLIIALIILLLWSFIPQYMHPVTMLIQLISAIKLIRLTKMHNFLWPEKTRLSLFVMLLFAGHSIIGQEKMAGITLVAPAKEYDADPMVDLRRVNANWVALVPFGFSRQDSPEVVFGSDKQWWGERKEGIAKSIELAHKNGLKIMLKPQVWIPNGWVGYVDFESETHWKKWEDSYRAYILSMLEMSDLEQIDMLCIGTEYSIAVKKREKFWRDLIADVRSKFKGKITYSANWDSYEEVPFWDALDYVGISAYFPLTDIATPPTIYLTMKWQSIVKKLRRFHQKHKKQILFTEYGYLAADGAAGKTWELEKLIHDMPVNETAQANGYEALLKVFSKEAFWAGGFLWKWFPSGYGRSNRHERDYTPQNKKAEKVIKELYSQLSAQ